MKKFFLWLVILLIIIVVGAYFGRNIIVKYAMEAGVKNATGLDLSVGKVDIDLKNTEAGINDLRIKNPKGFEDPEMFSAPEIFVNFQVGDLLKKKLHLKEVRLNIAQFLIVKNKDGKLNLNAVQLKGNEQSKAEQKTPAPSTAKGPSPVQALQIDLLKLKIGKVVYKDYSKGTQPVVKEFGANIDQTVKDVTNIQALFLTIFQKAMLKAAIPGLKDFDVQGVTEGIQKEAEGAIQEMKNQAEELKKSLKLPGM